MESPHYRRPAKYVRAMLRKKNTKESHKEQEITSCTTDNLYKTGVSSPWLKCILPDEGIEILEGIHAGICRSHIGARELVGKAVRQGFFWPTMANDAEQVARTCEACKKNANNQSALAGLSQLITPT